MMPLPNQRLESDADARGTGATLCPMNLPTGRLFKRCMFYVVTKVSQSLARMYPNAYTLACE